MGGYDPADDPNPNTDPTQPAGDQSAIPPGEGLAQPGDDTPVEQPAGESGEETDKDDGESMAAVND